MRISFIAAAMCFCLLPLFSQQQTNTRYCTSDSVNPSTIREEIALLTEQWKRAYNSNDARNLIPLYDDNAQYISAHVDGYIAEGRDNVLANFQRGMSGGGHIDSITVLSITQTCTMASVLCRYDATNSGVRVNGRNLLVSKKIDGQWRIITHMTVVKD